MSVLENPPTLLAPAQTLPPVDVAAENFEAQLDLQKELRLNRHATVFYRLADNWLLGKIGLSKPFEQRADKLAA